MKFEDFSTSTAPDKNYSVVPLKGSVQSLSLDGPEEALVQIVKKINELVDKVNEIEAKNNALYVVEEKTV